VTDEKNKGRKIDLSPKPSGTRIWIDGRRYTQYDSLLPIECKRLPTPKEKDRDEREYVFSQYSSTGGIQRFKAGLHGARHLFGAMIGYVQQDTVALWDERIRGWITALVERGEPGWNESDLLQAVLDNVTRQVAVLSSTHDRASGLPKIELRHLWIQLN
jgi:hypothetical protein